MSYEPGTTYGGRYRLLSRIAVGGMGEVWRATDQVLGRTVAIKLLGSALAAQPGFAQRFREEARHTAMLGHPNIAQVYDYGEDGGAAWLVMELVEGKPLSQILRDEGALSPERTVSIVAQAADALQAAHDMGVIHRDVKPANILVRPDGVVKLTDFGIARAADAAPLTRTGEVMGTAQYISPEQAMGHAVGPTSDLYSLGCVAYEMLAGRRLFDEGSAVGTAMAHVNKPAPPLPNTVPSTIAAVVMGCLAKDPLQRPPSGKGLSAALRGLPGATYPPTQSFPATGAQPTQRLGAPTGYALGGPAAGAAGAAAGAAGAAGAAAYGPAHGAPPYGPVGYPATGPGPLAYGPPPGPAGGGKNSARWMVPLILALLALLVFAIVQSGILGGSPGPATTTPATTQTSRSAVPSTSSSAPTTTSVTATTSTPTKVEVNADDYLNEPVEDVRVALEKRGLFVRITEETSNQPRGTVLGLSEYGSLDPGQTVTLTVSRGPAPTTTTPPPATSSPPPTTPAPTTNEAGGGQDAPTTTPAPTSRAS
ncbi:MAG: serine/threonine protein kinase [Austwickia sp.]|jgi:hypothetical protein|nr:serine/threonine protein kinase [Austwickia sp.]MBK8437296.1 serine/threonine protein kinase [Austwickia sp.]